MLKRIVMHIRGLVMGQYTHRLALQATLLWHNVRHLLVSFIQAFLSAVSQLFQLVLTTLNIRAWRANLTTLAQSIKAVLISVLHKATRLGQQLLTTVLRINLLARILQSQNKDKHAASTKSVRLRSNENRIAQTLMGVQLTADGLKSQEAVSQRRQRAKRQRKQGN